MIKASCLLLVTLALSVTANAKPPKGPVKKVLRCEGVFGGGVTSITADLEVVNDDTEHAKATNLEIYHENGKVTHLHSARVSYDLLIQNDERTGLIAELTIRGAQKAALTWNDYESTSNCEIDDPYLPKK